MSWKNLLKLAILSMTLVALGPAAKAADPLSALWNWFFDKAGAINSQVEYLEAARAFDEKNPGSLFLANGSSEDWDFGLISDPGHPLLETQLKDGKSFGELQVCRVNYSARAKGYVLGEQEPLPDDRSTVTLLHGYSEIAITPSGPKYARLAYIQDQAGQRIYFTLTPDSTGKQPRLGFAGVTANVAMLQGVVEFSDPEGKKLNRVSIQVNKVEKN